MSKRKHERGAVLVETALIVSTALTLMLFTVDIGILGFAQVSADAASFVDAHENVTGMTSGTPETYTAGLFPIINASSMTTTTVPAPAPSVQVNYGYNAPDPSASSGSTRVGGVSMMQPVQLQVTVSPAPLLNIAGQAIGVSSQAIEPKWTECGPHYNVANEDVACGSAGAPPNSTATLATGENTPPYYVGYNLMTHCMDSEPFGDTANGAEATCQTTNFLALGMGEYLDSNNWGPTSANMNPGVSGTVGQSIFYAAAFHQRVYSNISQFFAKYPTLFALYLDYDHKIYNTLGITSFASGNGTSGFNSFANWNEFAVSNTADPTKADPNGIDEAIQCVYSWDQTIAAGFAPGTYTEPGDVPLSPTHQCAANVTL
jgi:Flp pilus assembly protein TadG